MEGLLPDDSELLKRKEGWEDFFKKYSLSKDEEEVELERLSDILENKSESEGQDTEKENAPEAVEVEEQPSQESPGLSPRTLRKQLQLAVKEREVAWKEKGLSFTFDKVDEWLKHSEYQNRKELVDPRTGGHMIEQTHHKKMHVKRKYRNNKKQQKKSPDVSISESDTELSDVSSNSSVDTAQYIRANQNHRTSKVTKTIIKKYIVKHINHHRHERHAPISHRRASMPLQAITNEPTSSSKKKQRKTRHELNKRRRTHRESNSDSGSSSSESPQSSQKKRKTPAKLSRVNSEPVSTNVTPSSHSKWVSGQEVEEIASRQPQVALERIFEHDASEVPSPHPKKGDQRVIPSTSANKNDGNTDALNETAETKSISSSSRSRMSSIFNMSRKSWAHLPKKVVIYHPDLNTTQEERVRITNAHFEQAIGTEAAKEFLQSYQYEKVIDANSQVILERPSSGDEEISEDEDSERDPLDYFEVQVPKLTIVPMDQS